MQNEGVALKKDKIFDEEVKSYLIELGMEEEEIEITRRKKLKEYAISTLNKVIEAIESNNYDSIKQYLSYSPSGDCMGCDNAFIDFGGITDWRLDIEDLFQYLSNYSIKNSDLVKGE